MTARWGRWQPALWIVVGAGAGVRRWLLLGFIGGGIMGVGGAYLFRYFSRATIPDFLPWRLEAVVLLAVGLAALGVASWRLYRLVGRARAGVRPEETLRASLVRHYQQERGPRVVGIGGGTGLSTMLRGIKDRTSHVTGIVTVADDGGSSGRLREDFGVLPPGDFRNCIVALAEAEPLMKDLFQYRFAGGKDLDGHSFGNLFIVAMSAVTGSFEDALAELSRVLKVTGRIVPSTLEQVQLVARMADGSEVRGESRIPNAGSRIERIGLDPEKPQACVAAVEAIEEARLIVIGPGSLYTSILPSLLVPGIDAAIRRSAAPAVYVCNVATQPGETEGFDVADHVRVLREHCPNLRLDHVLVNSNYSPLGPKFPRSALVRLREFDFPGVRLWQRDLMNDEFRGHHDPGKLATALIELYHVANGRNGPRGNGWLRLPARAAPAG
ncbi:MAG: YvcK family protein [Gemmatimonadetes bacterium]|nr:YvcK family protein [Gemmatimonadota bacterium]